MGVIEAGDYYPTEPKINVPGMFTAFFSFHCFPHSVSSGLFGSIAGDPQFDWLHMATPQPGLGNGTQLLPRAKALGGTSVSSLLTLISTRD